MNHIRKIRKFIGREGQKALFLICARSGLGKIAAMLKAAGLGQCLIVYVGLEVPGELRRSGLAVKASEDFLQKDDYERIDEFVFSRLASGWYAYLGATDYRGMPLGKILEYDFQGFLIPRVKNLELLRKICAGRPIQKIAVIEEFDEIGLAALDYGRACNMPVLRVSLGRRKVIWVGIKGAVSAFLSNMCDWLARRRLSSVPVVRGLVLLDARLQKFFKSREKDIFFVPSLFEKGLKVRFRLLVSAGAYLPFYSFGQRRYKNEWLFYLRKWRELSGDVNFRNIFIYQGISFWGMVEEKLKGFFCSGIPRIISNMKMLERLLDTKKINLAVMRNDVKEAERALVFTLRLRRIPSLVMQHGVFADNKHKTLFADRFAAWGQASLDLYRDSVDSYKRCVITGNPNFDFLLGWHPRVSRRELFRRLGLDENKGMVLLVTQQIHKLSAYLSDDLCRVMADRVLSAMQHFPDKQTVIKADPYEDMEIYRNLISEKSFNRAAVVKDIDIFTLVYFSDAVIIFNSTAGLEALFFDKPLITVNFTKRQDTVGYAQKNAAVGVYSQEGLAPALNRVFSDKETRQGLEAAKGRFLEEYAYRLDGRVVERLLGLINRMMGGLR